MTKTSIIEINNVFESNGYINGFASFSNNQLIKLKMPKLPTERYKANRLSTEIIDGYFVVAYRLISISGKIKLSLVLKLDTSRTNYFPESFDCLIAGDYIQVTETDFKPTNNGKE